MVYIIVLLKLLISDDGNCEEEAELGKVTMLGYIIQKLVNGSTCWKLPATSAEIDHGYVIYFADSVSNGESEHEWGWNFWLQMSNCRNAILAEK